MMNSHAVETLSKMPGETKARPLPNTPSPPIGFWASPNDSPGLTTATSSPSICSSPSMSRNDSVHSILVLWDGGNDAQECLIPQGNFCSGLGLGMGSKSTSEEIPDDVSLAGGGSNKGSPEVETRDKMSPLPTYSPYMESNHRSHFSTSTFGPSTAGSISDSSSSTLVSPSGSIQWSLDPTKTVTKVQQEEYRHRPNRDSINSMSSAFTISAYYDPEMTSPTQAGTNHKRSSTASSAYNQSSSASLDKRSSADSTRMLLGLERARQMQRHRSSTSSGGSVQYETPLSEHQSKYFNSSYTLSGQDKTSQALRSCKSFEVSTKSSGRTKGTPPPLPFKEGDLFGMPTRNTSSAKEAAYQLFHEGVDFEPESSDAPPSIAIVVDQEGFREVEASLNFVRYIPDTNCFQFAVVEKIALPYNWSKMQSDPVLRKLRVPLYGEKDFLTRQACLSIRDNGVWEVHGKEGRGGKWKFTYKVEDRLTLLGKAKSGEKNLIPVAFECTPEVLDDTRRVRFFHKLGKSLTPKLSASRLKARYNSEAEVIPPVPLLVQSRTSSRTSSDSGSRPSLPCTPLTSGNNQFGELSSQQKYFYNHMLQNISTNNEQGIRPSTAGHSVVSRPALSANSFLQRPSTASGSPSPVRRPATAEPAIYLSTPLTPLSRPQSRQRAYSRPSTPATPRSASSLGRAQEVSTPLRISSLTTSEATPKAVNHLRPATADSGGRRPRADSAATNGRPRAGSVLSAGQSAEGRIRHRSVSRLLPFEMA